MSMLEENSMNLLTIRNRNIPYVFQDEWHTCSAAFVYIFCARESIVSVILQSLAPAAIKMAARFFFHGDLAKVVLSGTPLLRRGQYHRTFLDSG